MLIGANVVVFVLLAAVVASGAIAKNLLNEIHHVSVKNLAKQQYVIINGHKYKVDHKTFTMLLIGEDSRSLAKNSGFNVGNSQSNSENLSDAIMLARVAPATHQMALLSIPRDLLVNVPGLGQQKINAAFAGGDPSRLVWVIEHELHIPVQHYAGVGFDAFEQIANTVGGVEQYFPAPAMDAYSGLRVARTGCVLLKGDQALAFVRSRHYQYYLNGQWQEQNVPISDLARIQRQQAFIKNAIKKAEHSGDLTNPLKLEGIVSGIAKNLTIDSTFSTGQLIGLAEEFKTINPGGIPNMTLPVQTDGDGLSLIPGASQAVINKFEAIGSQAPASATASKGKKPKSASASPTSTSTAPVSALAGVQVAVQNGSGQPGQASQIEEALSSLPVEVSSVGDAANFGYSSNVVEYGSGARAKALALADRLAGGAQIEASSTVPAGTLVLVSGSDWSGLGNGSAITGGAATSTTTNPESNPLNQANPNLTDGHIQADASSTYQGVYIAPGRVPGQKVSTCGN